MNSDAPCPAVSTPTPQFDSLFFQFEQQTQTLEMLCEQVDQLLEQQPLGSFVHSLARAYSCDRATAWVMISLAQTDYRQLLHADTRCWNGAQLALWLVFRLLSSE